MSRRNRIFLFAALTLALLILGLVSIGTGPVDISLKEVFGALLDPKSDSIARQVVWNVRLPHLVAALLAGASLSVSGLCLQTVFRNPLAGPFVLGISSGASFGVALAMLAGFSFGRFGVLSAAALGAMAVTLIVLWVASRFRQSSVLLIVGILVGYFIDALTSFLIAGSRAEALKEYVSWGMGSFGRLTADTIWVFALAVAVGFGLILSAMKYLNGARLGDDFARGLGIQVQSSKIRVLLGASILAASATAFCGPVAFVGIAVPHLAFYLFKTSNHRVLLPASALCGAVVSVVAGFFPLLPLNAVLSVVGVPVILWVLLTSVRREAL